MEVKMEQDSTYVFMYSVARDGIQALKHASQVLQHEDTSQSLSILQYIFIVVCDLMMNKMNIFTVFRKLLLCWQRETNGH